MLPLAPGLLSTTTGCPSRPLLMSAAIIRATVSRMPPGATGTTSVTGLEGNAWENAAVGPSTASAQAIAASLDSIVIDEWYQFHPRHHLRPRRHAARHGGRDRF